ncbi:hypothetical protein RJ639_036054, partial [Escallonia herrerae]
PSDLKLEKVGLGTNAGKLKVVGTLMGIGGAMLLTFYKGVEINIWPTKFDLLHHGHTAPSHQDLANHIVGPLLAITSCFSNAFGLITDLIAVMGSLQGIVFALCMERDRSQWRLGWEIRFFMVAYIVCRIIISIVHLGLTRVANLCTGLLLLFLICHMLARDGGIRTNRNHHPMVCTYERPLIYMCFNPLILLLVAIAGSLLLNEKLYLGSIELYTSTAEMSTHV